MIECGVQGGGGGGLVVVVYDDGTVLWLEGVWEGGLGGGGE